MSEVSFDVPRYYDVDFKGRKPKHCPKCNSKMEYDGWSCDTKNQKLSEWWLCKKCDKQYDNPD